MLLMLMVWLRGARRWRIAPMPVAPIPLSPHSFSQLHTCPPCPNPNLRINSTRSSSFTMLQHHRHWRNCCAWSQSLAKKVHQRPGQRDAMWLTDTRKVPGGRHTIGTAMSFRFQYVFNSSISNFSTVYSHPHVRSLFWIPLLKRCIMD